MKKILIIDDEKNICISLEFALEDYYKVIGCQDPYEGLEVLRQNRIDLILLDLRLGSLDGIEILRKIKEINSEVPVIIMTAFGSIQSSVEAVKAGAFYYITKPIETEELKILIAKALDYNRLSNEVKRLSDSIRDENSYFGIIGRSPKIQDLFITIEKVKDINSNVLIIGESGTGKEMVARALHYGSKRKDFHFEAINCSAIPSQLMESEFFGHRKGAFTGADDDRIGKFELCDGGTIFLDEIGDMDIHMQAKLLRVLQDKEITPLGTNKRKQVSVRVIAATNKDLEKATEEGSFREDLFYRLNVITIKIPPLRERKEDIPLLVAHFIKKYNRVFNKEITGLEPGAIDVLEKYDYKGNVRELENIIERAMALTGAEIIKMNDLPEKVIRNSPLPKNSYQSLIGQDLSTIEREVIIETYLQNNRNKTKTASVLGITEKTLRNKMKQYGYGEKSSG